MARRFGWTVAVDRGCKDVHLEELTVRAAYGMLMQPVMDLRRQRWQELVAETLTGQVDQDVTELQLNTQHTLMLDLWRQVKWHNQHKQMY